MIPPEGTKRTGLILAAGFGSRLRKGRPDFRLKPVTLVGGRPLIVRAFESLQRAGCARIVVVLGHEADALEATIRDLYRGPLPIEFVFNPQYKLANGVSVLAARERLDEEFVLTMADHVLGDDVMELTSRHRPPAGGASLLVDYKLESIFDMDDATKVLVRDGRVVTIGKQLAEFNCVDTGVFVCSRGLLDAIEEVYRSTDDASLSQGVQRLAERGRMLGVDIGNGFWQDVDTPEMLAHAEEVLEKGQAS